MLSVPHIIRELNPQSPKAMVAQLSNAPTAQVCDGAIAHLFNRSFAPLQICPMAQIHICPTHEHHRLHLRATIDIETFRFPEKWLAQFAKAGA